jgi:hypothetical protein
VGEYQSRGPAHAEPTFANASYTARGPDPTPQDRARDAVAIATRETRLVHAALEQLNATHAANDLARWREARRDVDRAIVHATRRLDQTRGQLREATPEVVTTFERATRELAQDSDRAQTAEPPKGYVQVAREDELLATLRAPSVAGFAGRRDAVRGELDQLAIADLRVLRARIASPQPQDELAHEIWKLGPQLRQEVATFIENVDRRKARERVAATRRTPPAISPDPETVDTMLQRAIEGSAIEAELLGVIATLDGLARRTLATRLRSYRPGSGDGFAARFIRLDPTLRERIFMELAREKPRVGVADAAAPSAPEPNAGSIFALATPTLERAPANARTTDELAAEIAATVQRVTGKPSGVRKHPEQYLHEHAAEAWDVIGRYLRRVELPPPSPRLVWRDDRAFIDATVRQLATMHLFDRREALLEVLYPSETYALLASLIPVGDTWVPTVGSALAQQFEQAIVESLRRLGPRWVELAEHRPEPNGLADETQSLVAASSLIPSAPIDLAVRVGLTTSAVVALTETHALAPRDGKLATLRPVRLEWQGTRDKTMWNWVRALEPTDATAEEVAASLWKQRPGGATEYAYALVHSGSFFGIPAAWAREFHETDGLAPAEGAKEDSTAAQLVALASGKAADELALDAAAHESHAHAAPGDLARLLGDVAAQLDHLHERLGAWQLGDEVAVAMRWVARKQRELAVATPHDRASWAPIIAEQKARLIRIAEGAGALASTKPSGKEDPVRHVLTTYARAIATSFLGDASDRLIASAAREQATLTLTALRASTNDLAVAVGDGRGLDPKQLARAEQLAGEARTMQTETLAGHATDPDEVERVTLGTQELSLHLRIEQLQIQLRALRAAAAQASEGVIGRATAAFPGKFHDLDLFSTEFANHLMMVQSAWSYDISSASQVRDPDEYGREMLRLRGTALGRAQARFAQIKNEDGLVTFLEAGASVIEHELRVVGWVTACVEMLALIGVGMVASAAGGAVAETIAGWGASADAIESATLLARSARIAGRVAGLATEGAANTAGQRALQGNPEHGSFVEGMAENALMSFGSELVLARIGKDLEFAKDIERSTGSMWARTKTAGAVLLAKGVTISSHVIINAAMSYVAHQIVKGGHAEPSNAALAEWFMQGAAVGLGRYLHGQIGGRRELYAKLAALRELEQAKHLLRDANSLLDLAAAAESAPTDRHALELLARQRQLLGEELAVLEAAATDPAKLRALELTAPTVRGMKRFASAQLAELDATDLAELPLRSAQLQELIPGEVWSGSVAEIHAALEAAGHAKLETTATRDEHGTWKIRIDQRTVTVHEVAEPTSAKSDHWSLAREALLADRIPNASWLPDTQSNRDGLVRLADIYRDPSLPASVRKDFLAELHAEIRAASSPRDDLFKVLNNIAHRSPDKYLRKGPRIPDAEYVRNSLGGLQRAVSLKACTMMVSASFYARAFEAARAGGSLPRDQDKFVWSSAQVIVDLIKSGRIEFDPMTDLKGDALIKGYLPGSSGWYFAATDAASAIGSPADLQQQLAVGPEYADGYVILGLPHDLAAPLDRNAPGARRPTALDLTLAPEGKLNAVVSEPVGRTNPQKAGQVAVREVVMPPVPLSQIPSRTYVPGGSK